MADLSVHLYGTHIGDLVATVGDRFDFRASRAGIERFGLASTVLSMSVPLVERAPRGQAQQRRNFFDGLLPEGAARERLAFNARVPANNTLMLLATFGRDVAGAVEILNSSGQSAAEPGVAVLTDAQVQTLLSEAADYPLGNRPPTGKASLAGVQEKVLLARDGDAWARCLNGYPSTHIIKPVSAAHPDMIFNEEYCARLARALGLAEHSTTVETFDGVDALVVERYDRSHGTPDGRLHQEDMCQALGAPSAQKYQEHGGQVSLRRIAALLRQAQGPSGVEALLSMTVLAVATGNLDMHAKNISLLHPPDGSTRLAPAYDVVPMTHYPELDGRMALSVNGVYEHRHISGADIIAESKAWGVPHDQAMSVVAKTTDVIMRTVLAEQPHARAWPGLAERIHDCASRLAKSW